VNSSIKEYARKMLQSDSIVVNFYNKVGTMGMADVQNFMGGLPVRNFSAGRQADVAAGEVFKMGGDYIGELNTSRGGEQTHPACPAA
jgi:aldehyde:ferredoxin oxidoreductase